MIKAKKIVILSLGDYMRNTKFIAIFLFSIILLTGCESKELSCTKEETADSGKVNEKQVFIFKNNTISTYDAEMVINLNDDFKDYADLLLESLESPFEEFKDKKGITYKTSKNDNKISVSISADYDKIYEDTKKSLGIFENPSFEKTKKTLEDDGYKCK